MKRSSHDIAEELRPFIKARTSRKEKLRAEVRARCVEGKEDRWLVKDELVAALMELAVDEVSARTQVSSAFKACGIRFRRPGGGGKRGGQTLAVKDVKPGVASAIQAIEKMFGATSASKRKQLSRILGALAVHEQPQIELVSFDRVQMVDLEPQRGLPAGIGYAPATDPRRLRRRAALEDQTTVVIDQRQSERAEDLAEGILRSRYGKLLFRAGHRNGETRELDDGMVPGADLYVMDAASGKGDPVEFIEVKSVAGDPPFLVAFTRGEYLRAIKCAERGVPYRLVLFDVRTEKFWEARNFAASIAELRLEEVRQFVVRIISQT